MCDFEKRITLDELNVVINFTEPVKHLSKDNFQLTGGKIKTLRMKSKTLYNATLDISRAQGTDSVVRSIELLSNGTWCSSVEFENITSFSCFCHVTQITRIYLASLTHNARTSLEIQCSNSNSIMT